MDAIQFTTEIINAIIRHGWSLTTLVVAVMALLRVNGVRRIILRRLPKRFRYEDKLERMERKIDALSAHMGVPKCDLPQTTLNVQLTPLCGKSISLLQVGNRLANRLRRMKRMQNQINWFTLTTGVLGAVKLILQSFQIDIPDTHINDIANGVAALAAVVGVLMTHRKQPSTNEEKVSEEVYYH